MSYDRPTMGLPNLDGLVGGPPLVDRGDLERLGALAGIDPLALARAGGRAHVDEIRGGIAKPFADADEDLIATLRKRGSSLRIKRTQVLDEPIREWLVALHVALDEELNANLYLSPQSDAAGLAPHVDPYDVFIIQLAGAKRWQLYGDDPHTFVLEAGDLLYLPANVRHDARNEQDDPSLHLTVGIFAKTEHSVVEWLMAELSKHATGDVDEATFDNLASELRKLLADPARRARFEAHRRAVEYERMLASPSEHARMDARKYR